MAVNGVYIVEGEMNQIVFSLRNDNIRRKYHPQVDEQDPLFRNFADLRGVLNTITDLSDMTPNSFLSPFLDVIRDENTSAHVTTVALSAIGKFLSYGLIDQSSITAASAVENIVEAVTRARFTSVPATAASDELVFQKLLQVLRILLLTPVGSLLTNESVCEIMQSCFKICFEPQLSLLLQKASEYALMDMIQLLFTRLPTFTEDPRHPYIRKLQMRAKMQHDVNRVRRKKKYRKFVKKEEATKNDDKVPSENPPESPVLDNVPNVDTTTPSASADSETLPDRPSDLHLNAASDEDENGGDSAIVVSSPVEGVVVDVHDGNLSAASIKADVGGASGDDETIKSDSERDPEPSVHQAPDTKDDPKVTATRKESGHSSDEGEPRLVRSPRQQRVNERGVRFTADADASKDDEEDDQGPLIPYGLPCIREVFRFLISLTNPQALLDRAADKYSAGGGKDLAEAEQMILIGLNLLTIALEAGADYLGNYTVLMPLVKNDLCRCLYSLLGVERPRILVATTRVWFLLIESLRTHLKFQLEVYLVRLIEVIAVEAGQQQMSSSSTSIAQTMAAARLSLEQREISLDSLVQLWRIPGLVTELYLNYDSDLYSTSLFEDVTKLLSQSAFPAVSQTQTPMTPASGGIHRTHILALDALLTVVDTIEANCHYRMIVSHRERRVSAGGAPLRELRADGGGRMAQSPLQMLPPSSGYASAKEMPAALVKSQAAVAAAADALRLPQVRPNRMTISEELIPTHEELVARRKKKQLFAIGSALFNQAPTKGVQFLQEHGVLMTPLSPAEVVEWLKENPRLDKRLIGEYISNRKHSTVLQAFVHSFQFDGVRIDDALRAFLETFRLPGEAPLISMIMEHFAEHWYVSNDEPFASKEAAFVLGYAVIMLNTDQHNKTARKQMVPMTVADFKRNLSKVNGGEDFDQEMLEDIFQAIKNEEIIMPAERTGLVREAYVWKCLLKRGASKDGVFVHAPNGLFDHDLFALVWGPTLAAVSSVFDKSNDDAVVHKALGGFRKLAAIAAHYGMCDVLDNLVISLAKFSSLLSCLTTPDLLAVTLGANQKAQMATRALFDLVHEHGDVLREGWRSVFDCVLEVFKAKMAPKALTEAEDFLDPKGWISILREHSRSSKVETSGGSLFSSLYSYFGASTDRVDGRVWTQEEQEWVKVAQAIIGECHLENIVLDSKYLTTAALNELLRALVDASNALVSNESADSGETGQAVNSELSELNEDAMVLFWELLVSVTLENKDRLAPFWREVVRAHLTTILTRNAKSLFLIERAVVGQLRLAIRLLFREEIADDVLESLELLLLLPPATFARLARQIAHGLHELLRTNAANIHRKQHYSILFTLLECAGASAFPRQKHSAMMALGGVGGSHSDVEYGDGKEDEDARGYTSDSEVYDQAKGKTLTTSASGTPLTTVHSGSGEWMYVVANEDGAPHAQKIGLETGPVPFTKGSLLLRRGLKLHDSMAFLKCCDALAFLVRDAAHITPENFESCVHCLRTFVEASMDGGRSVQARKEREKQTTPPGPPQRHRRAAAKKPSSTSSRNKSTMSSPTSGDDEGAAADDDSAIDVRSPPPPGARLADQYLQVSLQLLDLSHTLHVKAAAMFRAWSASCPEVNATPQRVWRACWCPLLQAIARQCCDGRRQVRMAALSYLQRALLIPDLQASAVGGELWEACFSLVLFPLLAALLVDDSPASGMEETRVRANTLLCKVFLQHLAPLCATPTFVALWMTILDFLERYMRADRSDLLSEAVPESLKNMLLVMDTTQVFETRPTLYAITRERVATYLPQLLDEVLPHRRPGATGAATSAEGKAGGAAGLVVATAEPDDAQAAGVATMAMPPPSPVERPVGGLIHGGAGEIRSASLVSIPDVPLQEIVVHRT